MPNTRYTTEGFYIDTILTPRRQLKVGVGGVIRIDEHAAQGEGDRWYYDVRFGLPSSEIRVVRIFDVLSVEFAQEGK